MNDLSMNISSQIGALELGDHLQSYGDSALEAAGANMALGPTQVNCGPNPTIVIRCVSDGTLESAATTLNGPPTRMIIGTRCQ
jgi:hypothetical protein